MGWTYAKYLLEKERTTSAFLYFNKRELEKAREIARGEDSQWHSPDRDARVRAQAGAGGGRRAGPRILGAARAVDESNGHNLNAVVSALKLRGSALQQQVTDLQVEALGLHALRFWGHGEGEAMDARAAFALAGFRAGSHGRGADRARFHHLRRIAGSAEEHHRQAGVRPVGRDKPARGKRKKMDFNLTDEQQMLRESASRFVREQYGFEARRKWAAEGGWSRRALGPVRGDGLAVAVDPGGAWRPGLQLRRNGPGGRGTRARHRAGALRRLRGAGRAPDRAGDAPGFGARREALLAGIADGSAITLLAHSEPGSRFELDSVSDAGSRDRQRLGDRRRPR